MPVPLTGSTHAAPASASERNRALLETILLNGERLRKARALLFAGDDRLAAADQRLLREADEALGQGPLSVADKEKTPPGGDPRDYASLGPYWWPDPESADGLPYIHRDGEVNPEVDGYDSGRLRLLCSTANTLALAYYFSGVEDFADHAAFLLRAFFLDERGGMNPHMEYAQAIPGRSQGRGAGIMDARPLCWAVDAVALLDESPEWNEDDRAGMVAWFGSFLDWMLDSEMGREGRAAENSHGTWFSVVAASLALRVGRADEARRLLEEDVPRHLSGQLEADGRQPRELARTLSLNYSLVNLAGFFDLATLGEKLGQDWWGWRDGAGRGIRPAFDWLAHQAFEADSWPYEQIRPPDPGQWVPLLRVGAERFADAASEERLHGLEGIEWEAERTNLLYAPSAWLAGGEA